MKYLVETSFKMMPTPEMLALIPAEMAHGKALDAQGLRQWLLIAADQSKAWQLFSTPSLEATQALVAAFPLHPYVNTQITPIADGE